MLNDVEVWSVYNGTEDAHPIHLHLVAFQILDRQKFKADQDPDNGALSNINHIGKPKPALAQEDGWKDTAIMYPGEVTRVIAKFDREGRYVWHCHILSHEDHEMMRPYYVGPMAATQMATVDDGNAAGKTVRGAILEQNIPNPFNPVTRIRFHLAGSQRVELKIYNVKGQEVHTLTNGRYPAGAHTLEWDGKDSTGNEVSSGIYFYRLRSGTTVQTKRMVLLR
jgi:spore coat protein A